MEGTELYSFLFFSANNSLTSLAPFPLSTLLGMKELLPFIFLTLFQKYLRLPETRLGAIL